MSVGLSEIPVPTVSPIPEFPISCWSGVYVNGTAISNAGYQSCNGECAYISLTTSMTGVTYNAEIYTCDPTSVCSSMGTINNCLTLEPGVQACCCNSDACLTPKRKPGNPLTCYVGMYAVKAGINTGGEVWCNGQCSSLRTTVNNDDVTTFQCIPTTACKYLGLNNGCGTLTGDRDVTACCCDYANGCNLAMNNRTDITVPTPSPLPEFPISCWSGVYVNGTPITNIGFQTCYGECASVALTTGMGTVTYKAEIYTCDPTSVCNSMGMSNNCLTLEPGVQGCCCNTDACLTPRRKPGNVLWCYVGLYAKRANVNVGGEVACDGQCSSLSGIVNGDMVTTFQCVPKSVCRSLALDNHCASLPGDRAVKGCCCDFGNSCNVNQTGIPDINIPSPAPSTEFPISCWSGIYVNGNAITNAGFQSCFGECASVTLQTWVNGTQTNATIYTCDPTSVCKSLNMSNNCATVEPGLSGCCCNDDACLTPTRVCKTVRGFFEIIFGIDCSYSKQACTTCSAIIYVSE
ncbi:unnamed protein product [Cylicostephanus goldi]|uniref:ET module n=1 Tax=Cylicostephanus goldi TaxID=71465 RepID=A0A3P7LT73_CYLGO|nr:unnamed protein product [Cylicostephanus goldi]